MGLGLVSFDLAGSIPHRLRACEIRVLLRHGPDTLWVWLACDQANFSIA